MPFFPDNRHMREPFNIMLELGLMLYFPFLYGMIQYAGERAEMNQLGLEIKQAEINPCLTLANIKHYSDRRASTINFFSSYYKNPRKVLEEDSFIFIKECFSKALDQTFKKLQKIRLEEKEIKKTDPSKAEEKFKKIKSVFIEKLMNAVKSEKELLTPEGILQLYKLLSQVKTASIVDDSIQYPLGSGHVLITQNRIDIMVGFDFSYNYSPKKLEQAANNLMRALHNKLLETKNAFLSPISLIPHRIKTGSIR